MSQAPRPREAGASLKFQTLQVFRLVSLMHNFYLGTVRAEWLVSEWLVSLFSQPCQQCPAKATHLHLHCLPSEQCGRKFLGSPEG